MSKKKVIEQYRPVLQKYTEMIFEEFRKRGLIDNRGVIAANVSITRGVDLINRSDFQALYIKMTRLSNVVINTANQLYPVLGNPPTQRLFGDAIDVLESHGAFTIEWSDKGLALSVWNRIDALLREPEKEQQLLETSIKVNNVNIDKLYAEVLNFFGREKVRRFVSQNELGAINSEGENDMVVLQKDSTFSPIIFELKVRLGDPMPDAEVMSQLFETLARESDQIKAQKAVVVLIVFTDQSYESMESWKLRFAYELKDLDIEEDIKRRVKYIPISTGSLSSFEPALNDFAFQYLKKSFQVQFKNQQPPVNFPERNDQFLTQHFNLNDLEIKMSINPNKSLFWRFGLMLSREERFPPIDAKRHKENNIGFIHLSAGDLVSPQSQGWINPNQLTVTLYNINHAPVNKPSLDNYQGKLIDWTMKINHDASVVESQIFVEGILFCSQLFNLSEYKYFKIGAWADFKQFELNVDIYMVHR